MKQNSSQKRKTKGFTLVELIVVIAILAILAGVGAVAYTGYIEYTKKGLDKQTVGEIIHALELADYSDPTLFGNNPNGTVLLSSNGAVGTTPAIQKALDDAGIDATLSYEKWPGAIDAKAAANLVNDALKAFTFLDGENVNLTYAGVATQSWDAVKDAVGKVTELLSSGKFGTQVGDIENNAPALVLAAAKAASNPSDSLDWVNFNPSADNKNESLPSIVARNYSFAEYLRQNYHYDGMEKDIEDLQNVVATFNDLITNHYKDPFTDSSNANLYEAAQAYLHTTVVTEGGTTLSQAQIDNQGYNQMMKSMYDKYKDQLNERVEDEKTFYEFTGNASTFWDEAGGILSTAGQMAQMTAAERDEFMSKLPDEGTAIQVVVLGRGADGTLNVSAIPADAMPKTESTGDGGCSHTHTTGTVTLEYIPRTSIICPAPIVLCNTAGATSIQFNIRNYTTGGEGEIQAFSVLASDGTATWSWEGNEDNIVSLNKDGTLTASSVTEVKTVTLIISVEKISNPLRIAITIYP